MFLDVLEFILLRMLIRKSFLLKKISLSFNGIKRKRFLEMLPRVNGVSRKIYSISISLLKTHQGLFMKFYMMGYSHLLKLYRNKANIPYRIVCVDNTDSDEPSSIDFSRILLKKNLKNRRSEYEKIEFSGRTKMSRRLYGVPISGRSSV